MGEGVRSCRMGNIGIWQRIDSPDRFFRQLTTDTGDFPQELQELKTKLIKIFDSSQLGREIALLSGQSLLVPNSATPELL
jgi:hypothetical protein